MKLGRMIRNMIVFTVLGAMLISCRTERAPKVVNAGTFTGTWAEKSAERVIIMLTPTEKKGCYDAVVTWREDLPQKDIYTMQASYRQDGSLRCENCTYVVRTVGEDGKVSDEVQYTNGTGSLTYSPDEDVLYWTDDMQDPDESIRAFVKADHLAIDVPDSFKASRHKKFYQAV